jgi:hypothetical protein
LFARGKISSNFKSFTDRSRVSSFIVAAGISSNYAWFPHYYSLQSHITPIIDAPKWLLSNRSFLQVFRCKLKKSPPAFATGGLRLTQSLLEASSRFPSSSIR